MSKTFKSSSGVTNRFIEAMNGFKTKFGYWPTSIESEDRTIVFLATNVLTPLGFYLVQSKVELVIGEEGKILAKGREGDTFDYGDEGYRTEGKHKHDALVWLGLDE